jgi:rhodanese-related sulfurtransferase
MAHGEKFLALVNDAKKRIRETNVADVKRRMDAGEKFVLVDVREESEWAQGHLPGAIHLGKGIIERDVEQRVPDSGAKIILYCGGGFRYRWTAAGKAGPARGFRHKKGKANENYRVASREAPA